MPKRPRPLPDWSEITDDTPLHMETAARLVFPDGVVSGLALRNAAARGDLEYERLGGRIVTTLRFIREWRERNRHPAKEYRAASVAGAYRIATELHAKPSEAAAATQAALKARLQALADARPKSRKRAPKGEG